MKKKALAMVLATTMVASMAVGCGSKTDAPAADKGSTETAAAGDDSAAGSGKVYLLNFKPESDEAWQDLNIQNLRGICKAEIEFRIEIEGQRKPALEGIASFLYYFN